MTPTYDYRYRLPAPGGHTTCRVRIYREGEQTIALITWRGSDWTAVSPADRTVALAAALVGWHHPRRDGRFVLVEWLQYPRGDGPGGARETFATVDLAADEGVAPRHYPVARETVETLIGGPLTDREARPLAAEAVRGTDA